jgi:hypothetical protein
LQNTPDKGHRSQFLCFAEHCRTRDVKFHSYFAEHCLKEPSSRFAEHCQRGTSFFSHRTLPRYTRTRVICLQVATRRLCRVSIYSPLLVSLPLALRRTLLTRDTFILLCRTLLQLYTILTLRRTLPRYTRSGVLCLQASAHMLRRVLKHLLTHRLHLQNHKFESRCTYSCRAFQIFVDAQPSYSSSMHSHLSLHSPTLSSFHE